MAVFVLAGNFDQYTGWSPHNFYLYRAPETGRWSYLAWDLDVGFADHAFGQVPVIDQWNASWPLPRRPRPLIERILAHPELRARYRAYADDYLERHFRPEQVAAQLDALYAVIEEALVDDPYPAARITNPGVVGWPAILDDMKAFARRRYETARAELDAPLDEPPVYQQTPAGPGPQDLKPGPPSPDAPTKLRAVSVAPQAVVLEWEDNATGEAAYILQRCRGTGCVDFRNHHGEPTPDLTTMTDAGAKAGESYRYRVYAIRPTPQGPAGTGVSNLVEVLVPATRPPTPP